METRAHRIQVLAAIVLPLLVAGCGNGSGGGLFSLFDDSSGGGFFGLFSGNESTSNPIDLVLADSGSGGQGLTDPALVHNPEPASLALFGGGLVGLALTRRRKAKQQAS